MTWALSRDVCEGALVSLFVVDARTGADVGLQMWGFKIQAAVHVCRQIWRCAASISALAEARRAGDRR